MSNPLTLSMVALTNVAALAAQSADAEARANNIRTAGLLEPEKDEKKKRVVKSKRSPGAPKRTRPSVGKKKLIAKTSSASRSRPPLAAKK